MPVPDEDRHSAPALFTADRFAIVDVLDDLDIAHDLDEWLEVVLSERAEAQPVGVDDRNASGHCAAPAGVSVTVSNQASNESTGSGRLMKYPCAMSQPIAAS